MSGIMSKWSVVREHAVAPTERDGDGRVRAEALEAWIDDACRAYLAQCSVLEETRAAAGLVIDCRPTAIPGPLSADDAVVVSATASEVYPDAFTIAIRVRAENDGTSRTTNLSYEVRLLEPEHRTVSELGTAIRDELIALEHAASHYN